MNYSKQQLIDIAEKLKEINPEAINIFKTIAASNAIAQNKIKDKVNLTQYVVDKICTALVATGLVDSTPIGTKKEYKLTNDGEELINLMNKGEINL